MAPGTVTSSQDKKDVSRESTTSLDSTSQIVSPQPSVFEARPTGSPSTGPVVSLQKSITSSQNISPPSSTSPSSSGKPVQERPDSDIESGFSLQKTTIFNSSSQSGQPTQIVKPASNTGSVVSIQKTTTSDSSNQSGSPSPIVQPATNTGSVVSLQKTVNSNTSSQSDSSGPIAQPVSNSGSVVSLQKTTTSDLSSTSGSLSPTSNPSNAPVQPTFSPQAQSVPSQPVQSGSVANTGYTTSIHRESNSTSSQNNPTPNPYGRTGTSESLKSISTSQSVPPVGIQQAAKNGPGTGVTNSLMLGASGNPSVSSYVTSKVTQFPNVTGLSSLVNSVPFTSWRY